MSQSLFPPFTKTSDETNDRFHDPVYKLDNDFRSMYNICATHLKCVLKKLDNDSSSMYNIGQNWELTKEVNTVSKIVLVWLLVQYISDIG